MVCIHLEYYVTIQIEEQVQMKRSVLNINQLVITFGNRNFSKTDIRQI